MNHFNHDLLSLKSSVLINVFLFSCSGSLSETLFTFVTNGKIVLLNDCCKMSLETETVDLNVTFLSSNLSLIFGRTKSLILLIPDPCCHN